MLKFTEQEIRDHIRRYGVDIAGETIKEVARGDGGGTVLRFGASKDSGL